MMKLAAPQMPQMGMQRMAPLAAPQIAPQDPSLMSQFAGKVGTGMAAKGLGKMGLSAMDPTGGIASDAAVELAAPAVGNLVGGWFKMGGMIPPKPMYQNMGGLTKGPLGMSDMLEAGKGKDVSKVTYKKKGGEIEDVMEISYHAPLAATPK